MMRAPSNPTHADDREASFDLVAIGCGPFNLGLAALASRLPDLNWVAFESNPELCWHRGLMFDDAELQLSFLADLVTLVDPTHPLSFLAYLREVDRLYAFYIREQFHPTRREYEDYLRWAAAKLPRVRFAHRVESVAWDSLRERFCLDVSTPEGRLARVLAKDLVLGIGTEPALPASLASLSSARLLHSAEYLHRQRELVTFGHVTVIGSGQSGAEVTLDLLRRNLQGGPAVSWLTRTRAFAPLDYTKLVLEMTTPDYVRYFHALPESVRERLVDEQWQHYKGISSDLLRQIHGLLYERELHAGLAPVELRCGVSVEAAREDSRGQVLLSCRHRDTGELFEQQSEFVIAATGYRERRPLFLKGIEALIRCDRRGRYRVRLDHSIELDDAVAGRIFVANAELHSHGVATPDLGVCAVRNATILNAVLGREAYRLPGRTAFTSFAPPKAAVAGPLRSPAHPSITASVSARPELG